MSLALLTDVRSWAIMTYVLCNNMALGQTIIGIMSSTLITIFISKPKQQVLCTYINIMLGKFIVLQSSFRVCE